MILVIPKDQSSSGNRARQNKNWVLGEKMDINKLLHKMTIEEKAGQLMQLGPFFFIKDLEIEVAGNVSDIGINQEQIFQSGSVLGIRNAEEMIEIQKRYLSRSRLQIPLIFMADIIHGYETIFPVPLALSSSWNPKLAYQMARVSAQEASAAGIHVTFSPMADLSRDPRWGRVVEGFGEDSFLSSLFVKQMVQGYQNDDISKPGNVASCVKHFAAYGAVEAGRDYNTVDVSRLFLHQYHLTGYKAAIDAGAKMIMTAFNIVDGVPSTVNSYLLREVLRDQWKFKGVTISDYDSLHQIIEHGCAEDNKEAALLGIEGGLDIEMASSCYVNYLKELIDEKKVDIKLIDEAVMRILELKNEAGLFGNPYKGANPVLEKKLVHSKEHLAITKDIADECSVLLKNENVLPIKKGSKIALIGPYAQSRSTNGSWSWHGKRELNSTLEEMLIKHGVSPIITLNVESKQEISAHNIEVLKTADIVIIAIGEDAYESGEARSKTDLSIPRKQATLVDLAKELGLKSAVVLYSGRPLILDHVLDADALLYAWFLGSQANESISEVLIGKVNPSGKLTMSFPRNVGQIPVYYNYFNTGRPKREGILNEFVSYYLDVLNTPLFPFGYGLSYASFTYGEFNISSDELCPDEELTVTIEVANQSDVSGFETIQLYLRDYVSKIARPIKELKGFKKIWFENQSSQVVEFKISINDLMIIDAAGNKFFEYGRFAVMVGPNSEEVQSQDFRLVKEKKL